MDVIVSDDRVLDDIPVLGADPRRFQGQIQALLCCLQSLVGTVEFSCPLLNAQLQLVACQPQLLLRLLAPLGVFRIVESGVAKTPEQAVNAVGCSTTIAQCDTSYSGASRSCSRLSMNASAAIRHYATGS